MARVIAVEIFTEIVDQGGEGSAFIVRYLALQAKRIEQEGLVL